MSMARLLRNTMESRVPGSNRRQNHAHPYLTQLRTVMRVHRPAGSRPVATATAASAHLDRYPVGLPVAQDLSRSPARVSRGARCLQYGRLLTYQSLDRPHLRHALGTFMVRWAIQQADHAGVPQHIHVNLDDSIAAKHKATRHLEGVDWHYDHLESTRSQPRYKNGLTYLACTVTIGPIQVTFDLRLYLRERTVRRINRRRRPAQRLHFVSKPRLARQILEALRPLLPEGS